MNIIPQTKQNIILDATTLSSLMSCGRLTDFRFNHDLQSLGGKSNSLEVGSIIHKALEVFYLNTINGFKRELAIQSGMLAAELYIRGCAHCTDFIAPSDHPEAKPSCGHQLDEYPGVLNTPQENESKPQRTGWRWALETCEQYFDYYKSDSWIPLEVEVVKGDVVYTDDNIRILWKAKLDLITDTNNGILPVDHKTAKQNRDMISMNNQFMGQCITMGTRNMVINHIGLQTSLKPAEKFRREVMSYSANRLLEWQSEILPYWAYKMIEYGENNYWPPNFTHCESKYGACPFMREVCSYDPNMREEQLKLYFKHGSKWDPSN